MRRFGAVAMTGLVLAGITFAEAAQATVISGIITGVLAVRPDNNAWNNTDAQGFFGGGNLTGDSVTVRYSYDIAYATLTTSATVAQYTASSQLSPGIFSLSVTVNGHTMTADGSGNHNNDFRVIQSLGSTVNNAFYVSVPGSGTIGLSNFLTTDSYSVSLLGHPYTSDFSGGIPLFVQNSSGAGDLMFIASPAASFVPEPASLALLGMSLTGLGWLRRRRTVRSR